MSLGHINNYLGTGIAGGGYLENPTRNIASYELCKVYCNIQLYKVNLKTCAVLGGGEQTYIPNNEKQSYYFTAPVTCGDILFRYNRIICSSGIKIEYPKNIDPFKYKTCTITFDDFKGGWGSFNTNNMFVKNYVTYITKDGKRHHQQTIAPSKPFKFIYTGVKVIKLECYFSVTYSDGTDKWYYNNPTYGTSRRSVEVKNLQIILSK